MKVAQYAELGRLEFVQAEKPVLPKGGVLVRLTTAAVCGSDLHVLFEMDPSTFPTSPGFSGHECVGLVEASDSPEFNPGDRVLVIPPEANAWAEHLAVSPKWLIPIPDHLSDKEAVLAQLLGCVIYTSKRLNNVLDKRVVVVGQGPAGLLFSCLLHQMGAKQIIGLDIVPHRLDAALKMGASETINVHEVDSVERVRKATNEHLGDIVIEAAGKAETINLCPELVKDFGEMVLFGGPKKSIMPFEFEKFLRKQLKTTSTAHTQQEPGLKSFRLGMKMIADRRIDVAPLISHHIPFVDLQYAMDIAHSKEDGAIKVLLDYQS